MGRRNKPKQGDPAPLPDDYAGPSTSKATKRKADDEGQPAAKKPKAGNKKGKGKPEAAPGGVRAQKRARKAAAAAAAHENESDASMEGEDKEVVNLETHKKCVNYSPSLVHTC